MHLENGGNSCMLSRVFEHEFLAGSTHSEFGSLVQVSLDVDMEE
jgi:hypothetical protein